MFCHSSSQFLQTNPAPFGHNLTTIKLNKKLDETAKQIADITKKKHLYSLL
jgi:hypothetical protein